MNKVKKIGIGIVIILFIAYLVIGNGNKESFSDNIITKEIKLGVYDKDGNNIYEKEIKTEEKYLIDVLNSEKDLNVITESSEYGAYIISIKGFEQQDNYYWSYYIDDEYAQVGVSSCEIENNKNYTFKLEKFE